MSTPARAPVVLLVQRNDDVEMYAEFLTHEGVMPLVASNAVDAFDSALHSDIVITGIRLNGELTGLDLIARLRADERTRDVPIIVLTASAWRAERERALTAGCDLFLPKPCLPEDLLRHIRLLLAADHGRNVRTSARATADQAADRRTHGTTKPRV